MDILDLINQYNKKVEEVGKDNFISQRDSFIKELTDKSTRTFRHWITNYNRDHNTNYKINLTTGMYEDVKELEELKGQTNLLEEEKTPAKELSPVEETKTDERIVQTSLYIPSETLKKLKIKAIVEETTFNGLINKLIEDSLK